MNIIDQLKRDEGCKLSVYNDHLGYATIGIGRMIDSRKGGGISQEEADYLLANDVKRVKAELSKSIPWIEGLDEVRQSALINMAFQLGTAGLLKFKNSLSLIERGKYAEASAEMLNSTWAKQTPNRAKRISDQIYTGIWQ